MRDDHPSKNYPVIVPNRQQPFAHIELSYGLFATLLELYQRIPKIFTITEIGVTTLSYLTPDEFRQFTLAHRVLLCFRNPSISDAVYPAHITNGIPKLFSHRFLSNHNSSQSCCVSNTKQDQDFRFINEDRLIECAKFSPDGKYFVTNSLSQGLKVRNVETGKCAWHLKDQRGFLSGVAQNGTGELIALMQDDRLYADTRTWKLLNIKTNQCIRQWEFSAYITYAALNENGNILLTAEVDYRKLECIIQKQDVYSERKNEWRFKLTTTEDFLRFHVNWKLSQLFITATFRTAGTTMFLNLETGLYSMKAFQNNDFHGTRFLDVSPDHRYMARITEDERILKIGNLDTEEVIQIPIPYDLYKNQAVDDNRQAFFVDEGNKIVLLTFEDTNRPNCLIRLFDVQSGALLSEKRHSDAPSYYAVYNEQFLLGSNSGDRSIGLFYSSRKKLICDASAELPKKSHNCAVM